MYFVTIFSEQSVQNTNGTANTMLTLPVYGYGIWKPFTTTGFIHITWLGQMQVPKLETLGFPHGFSSCLSQLTAEGIQAMSNSTYHSLTGVGPHSKAAGAKSSASVLEVWVEGVLRSRL